jgi:predicted nuclease of restriction endonuclease-like (RecB) superfamily
MAKAAAAPSPISVRFGKEDRPMREVLEARAKAHRRTLSEQMKFYLYLGMVASDNPDLPLSMIDGILEGREEFRARLGKPYEWGVIS